MPTTAGTPIDTAELERELARRRRRRLTGAAGAAALGVLGAASTAHAGLPAPCPDGDCRVPAAQPQTPTPAAAAPKAPAKPATPTPADRLPPKPQSDVGDVIDSITKPPPKPARPPNETRGGVVVPYEVAHPQKPKPAKPKPAVLAPKPAGRKPKPPENRPEPVATKPKPAATAPKPAAPKPAARTPKPTQSTDLPVIPGTTPVKRPKSHLRGGVMVPDEVANATPPPAKKPKPAGPPPKPIRISKPTDKTDVALVIDHITGAVPPNEGLTPKPPAAATPPAKTTPPATTMPKPAATKPTAPTPPPQRISRPGDEHDPALIIDRTTGAVPAQRPAPVQQPPPLIGEKVKPQAGGIIVSNNGPTQYEVDRATTDLPTVTQGVTTPAQRQGARTRLAEPPKIINDRIDELNDQIADGEQSGAPKKQVEAAKRELELRQNQLFLYVNKACDYDCDLDAPYEKTGIKALDEAAAHLDPSERTRANVLKTADLKTAADEAIEKMKAGEWSVHDVLDTLGYIPVVGAAADAVNSVYYAAEGNTEEALWSLGGAVPFAGDGAKAARTGRKVLKSLDDVEDASKAARKTAAKLGQKVEPTQQGRFLENMSRKVKDPESRAALEKILGFAGSGTRKNAKRLGMFLPSRTRGYASELRTLDELGKRSDVAKITLVPAKSGGRSPDFVIHKTDGTLERVEVTTVTGSGTGYAKRGIGRAQTPTTDKIRSAIERKVVGKKNKGTQFDAKLDGVPDGGTLAIHVRGGQKASKEIEDAVDSMVGKLRAAKVGRVEFYVPGVGVRTYVPRGSTYVIEH